MRKFWLYVALAVTATLPGLWLRATGAHLSVVADAGFAGLAAELAFTSLS